MRVTPQLRELQNIATSLFPATADEVADAHDLGYRTGRQ